MDLHHMQRIRIIRPDDWHCHLRDDNLLARTVNDTARCFERAIVMPNLSQPITTIAAAEQYRDRIQHHIPQGSAFTPLMTLYLTEQMSPASIKAVTHNPIIKACKLYPAYATTHSAAGIADIVKIYPLLATMEEIDLPLLIHGETTDPHTDIFDREAFFIEQQLIPLVTKFPRLRIVLEHISTKIAVDYILSAPPNVAATITAHHLLFNRNALLVGGLHPHYYCLPILKRANDQAALIAAATSGHAKFFLGTDSAPHSQAKKESHCGCAGIYSAHAAIELYTEVFDKHQALHQLEAFASINGAKFYQLPINTNYLHLIKKPWRVPNHLNFGNEILIPLLAGETLNWQIDYNQ